MVSGEFVALLATETLPVTFPVPAGAKVAVKVAACPGARMVPEETPVALNPAPETVTLEIVTLEFPAFVSVTVLATSLDTFTLPKLKEDELGFRSRVDASTERIAALLWTLPALSLTTTVNCALLSAVVSAGVVYLDEFAPLIAAPFLLH
jgi:hypothetical protein